MSSIIKVSMAFGVVAGTEQWMNVPLSHMFEHRDATGVEKIVRMDEKLYKKFLEHRKFLHAERTALLECPCLGKLVEKDAIPPSVVTRNPGFRHARVSEDELDCSCGTSFLEQHDAYHGAGWSEIPTTDRHDSQYWAKFFVGTPPIPVNAIPDSGSSNTWVNSKLCKSAKCLADTENGLYNPNADASSTFLEMDDPWQGTVNFVSGSLSGKQVKDRISVGHPISAAAVLEEGTGAGAKSGVTLNDDALVADHQIFNVVTGMKGTMFDETFKHGFGGIMGCSFLDMAANNVKPLMYTLVDQDRVKDDTYGFYFGRGDGESGALSIGRRVGDPRFYSGSLLQFPVVVPHYWELSLAPKGFRVGGHVLGNDEMGYPNRVLVDTGTTLWGTSKQLIHQIHQIRQGDLSSVSAELQKSSTLERDALEKSTSERQALDQEAERDFGKIAKHDPVSSTLEVQEKVQSRVSISLLEGDEQPDSPMVWEFDLMCNPAASEYKSGPHTKVAPVNLCPEGHDQDFITVTFGKRDSTVPVPTSHLQKGAASVLDLDEGQDMTPIDAIMPIDLPGRGVGPVIWGQLALRQMYATLTTGQKDGIAPHVGFAKAKHGDEETLEALQELVTPFEER